MLYGMKKRRPGRPLAGDNPRDEMIRLRVSKQELAALKDEARKRGLTVSDLLMNPWRKES